MYGIYDPSEVKLINKLRLGFTHLREHKFRHNFADAVNPLCACFLETENTEQQLILKTTYLLKKTF